MKRLLQHIAHFRLSIACFFFFVNCQLFPSIWINCFSQDPQFSQFYAAPLYLNPALTGTTPFARLVVNARNQWKKNVNRFDSRAVSLDINVRKWKSGFGFLATRSYAGVDKQWYDAIGIGKSVKLQSQTNLGFLYSYMLPIARHWYARGGLNFSYTFRSYDFSLLTFRDQFGVGGTISPLTQEDRGSDKIRYFDFSAGGLTYSNFTRDNAINYWFGISANHLTLPNQSFVETKSVLPLKTTFHAGAKIPIGSIIARKKNSQSISPAINYKMQGKFDQLDLGIYWNYRPVMFGVWYRGLPAIKKDAEKDVHHDALVFMGGIKEENLLGFDNDLIIGFSYDLTISKLSSTTTGSFEIAIIYEFMLYGYSRAKKPKFKEMVIPCPKL
ncbi:MAG: type IX secretion system membrane protein PorP/SprF [Cytophagales bacterium]|nr:type IX secretion system membrane protein PorP/SprF [Cytophagales bacterium]